MGGSFSSRFAKASLRSRVPPGVTGLDASEIFGRYGRDESCIAGIAFRAFARIRADMRYWDFGLRRNRRFRSWDRSGTFADEHANVRSLNICNRLRCSGGGGATSTSHSMWLRSALRNSPSRNWAARHCGSIQRAFSGLTKSGTSSGIVRTARLPAQSAASPALCCRSPKW